MAQIPHLLKNCFPNCQIFERENPKTLSNPKTFSTSILRSSLSAFASWRHEINFPDGTFLLESTAMELQKLQKLQRIAKFAVGSGGENGKGGEEKEEQEEGGRERERGVCGIGCVEPFFVWRTGAKLHPKNFK
jgi:hypothetical protein